MKKNIFNFLFAFIGYQVCAQNLIPNSSFDSLTQCPNPDTRNRNELLILPWFAATTYSTPDNFNECSTEPILGVPYNNQNFSYRTAHSGSGYAGIYVLSSGIRPDAAREYIEIRLSESLEKNQSYYVRFYVAPRRDSRYEGEMVYIDAIGMNFTDTLFFTNAPISKITPSIEYKKGKVIKDTINWTPICGLYKAKGKEKYATIGNFKLGSETIIEKENPTNAYYGTYFFLDDATVTLFNPLPDTLILCENKTLKLNSTFLDAKYQWNTGSKDSIITIDKAGIYKVEVTIDNCTLSDSVVVIMPKASDKPLKDTAICKGQTITLNPQTTGTYKWSTGSKNAQISVNTEGSYSVTVSNVCGDFTYNSTVKLKKCDCNIFVPNAFSPNNDGANDELQAFINCDIPIKVKRFQVFNRWGNLLFTQSNTNDIRWNGQVNGTQLDQGTFVWYMEYEIEKNGKMETKIEYGDFTIIL
jgi:gliding motility-associated-like protein